MDSVNNQFSDKEMQEIARAQGVKLAALLYSANITDQQKQAWLAVLPHMSLEQIDRLTSILENQFAGEQLKEIDTKFSEELESIKKEYEKELGDLDKDALKKIQNLTKNI